MSEVEELVRQFASYRDEVLFEIWRQGDYSRQGGTVMSKYGAFAVIHNFDIEVADLAGSFVVIEDAAGVVYVETYDQPFAADARFDELTNRHEREIKAAEEAAAEAALAESESEVAFASDLIARMLENPLVQEITV